MTSISTYLMARHACSLMYLLKPALLLRASFFCFKTHDAQTWYASCWAGKQAIWPNHPMPKSTLDMCPYLRASSSMSLGRKNAIARTSCLSVFLEERRITSNDPREIAIAQLWPHIWYGRRLASQKKLLLAIDSIATSAVASSTAMNYANPKRYNAKVLDALDSLFPKTKAVKLLVWMSMPIIAWGCPLNR